VFYCLKLLFLDWPTTAEYAESNLAWKYFGKFLSLLRIRQILYRTGLSDELLKKTDKTFISFSFLLHFCYLCRVLFFVITGTVPVPLCYIFLFIESCLPTQGFGDPESMPKTQQIFGHRTQALKTSGSGSRKLDFISFFFIKFLFETAVRNSIIFSPLQA
jgi:hypothetical protein